MKEILFLSIACVVLGTGLGAFLGIFWGLKTIGKTMAFTGGLMIGIVFLDLLPESLACGNLFIVTISLFIGIFFVALISELISTKDNVQNQNKSALFKVGIVLMIAMALHNFPEGMAIGSSGAVDFESGLLVAFMITLHDIPEGMAIAAPLVAGHIKKTKVFFLTIISGISTILGTLFGLWVGRLSDFGLAFCLASAGGAMLYIVFGELIPKANQELKDKNSAFITIIGIIVGIILLKIIRLY
ncbi:MAG: ZIP family metal transporter [Bacilli bacterium]|nr:ZIP family metal transporter [Bacilli bacterium]MDD4077296.1 ZIP family metal transporter [Bacilli bacterium]